MFLQKNTRLFPKICLVFLIFTAFTVQTSTFNQAGSGNNQKVEVEKNKFQQELAAISAACQRELALANALVAAKDETITPLRASFTCLN